MSRYVGRIQLLMLDHRDQHYYAGWEPLDEAHGYDIELAYERVWRHVQRGRYRCDVLPWRDCTRTEVQCCQGGEPVVKPGWRLFTVRTAEHGKEEG